MSIETMEQEYASDPDYLRILSEMEGRQSQVEELERRNLQDKSDVMRAYPGLRPFNLSGKYPQEYWEMIAYIFANGLSEVYTSKHKLGSINPQDTLKHLADGTMIPAIGGLIFDRGGDPTPEEIIEMLYQQEGIAVSHAAGTKKINGFFEIGKLAKLTGPAFRKFHGNTIGRTAYLNWPKNIDHAFLEYHDVVATVRAGDAHNNVETSIPTQILMFKDIGALAIGITLFSMENEKYKEAFIPCRLPRDILKFRNANQKLKIYLPKNAADQDNIDLLHGLNKHQLGRTVEIEWVDISDDNSYQELALTFKRRGSHLGVHVVDPNSDYSSIERLGTIHFTNDNIDEVLTLAAAHEDLDAIVIKVPNTPFGTATIAQLLDVGFCISGFEPGFNEVYYHHIHHDEGIERIRNTFVAPSFIYLARFRGKSKNVFKPVFSEKALGSELAPLLADRFVRIINGTDN